MFCNLHDTLDKIIQEKYNLPMQRKSLYLALFANFDHQSMHQVLQVTLIMGNLAFGWSSGPIKMEQIVSLSPELNVEC